MKLYKVQLTRKAQKQLDQLSNEIAFSIIKAIGELKTNPRPIGSIKLKGSNSQRIRVGNYRIIYEIFDSLLLIDIIKIGHRKDVYKQ